MKKKIAWAVIDRTIDIYWPNSDVGFYAVFPSQRIAKKYAEGYRQKVVKVQITY